VTADPLPPVPSSARIAFAGTPAFAARILEGLLDAGVPLVCVFSQPDQPRGRGRRVEPTPVREAAEARGLPVRQPASLKRQNPLADLDLDLLVVVAYGKLLPPEVLATPRRGCLNLHASLLPRWRGAAPVEHALLAGDEQTGMALMAMDEGLDTGPVYATARCPIGPRDTATALFERLAPLAVELCVANLAAILDGSLRPEPQPGVGVTRAPRLEPSDALLDWTAPAAELDRRVRAFEHRGGARTAAGKFLVKVLEAEPAAPDPAGAGAAPGTILEGPRKRILVACGPDGRDVLALTRVQLAGVGKERPMDAAAARNGYAHLLGPGCRLG
jgi:methionyl-tRNA formyltransferase